MITRKYLLKYTLLFAIMALLIYSWFLIEQRTLINQGDSWHQHYKAMVWYSRYLRNGFRELLLNQRNAFHLFELSLGEGSDIFQTLHYYAIGDPITFFSFLFPEDKVHIFYGFGIILRLYLSGLPFSFLHAYISEGKTAGMGTLAGAMLHVFCAWGICNSYIHYFFLNTLILLPLLILGVEKILREKKAGLFIIAVFLSAICNFYFLYMLALLTVLYAAVRLILHFGKNWKEGLLCFGRMVLASILGAAMAAVILLPVMGFVLGNSRMSGEKMYDLFYSVRYYQDLPNYFVTFKTRGLTYTGMGPAVIPVLIFLFIRIRDKKKSNRLFRVFFIMSMVMLLFPFFGQALNGFSYQSNRWTFAFTFLCAMIFAELWEDLLTMKRKEYLAMVLLTAGFALAFCLRMRSGTSLDIALVLVPMAIFLVFLIPGKKRPGLVFLATMGGILCFSFQRLAPFGANEADTGISAETIQRGILRNETAAVQSTADSYGETGYYRFVGTSDYEEMNENLIADISSTQYYWSIANPYVEEYRRLMGLSDPITYQYYDYENRASLMTLAGVKYKVTRDKEEAYRAYGYSFANRVNVNEDLSEENIYDVLKNDNFLPPIYTYENAITREEWLTHSAVQRQEDMMHEVVLETGGILPKEEQATDAEIKPELSFKMLSDGITKNGNEFVVEEKGATMAIDMNGVPESEGYLVLTGMGFDSLRENKRAPDNTVLHIETTAGVARYVTFCNKTDRDYAGVRDFAVSLGYTDMPLTSLTVSFEKPGRYSFDDFYVSFHSMDGFKDEVEDLKEEGLRQYFFDDDRIEADIVLDRTKAVCFAVPYTKGWRAEVDGEKTELLQMNIKNMGVILPKGEHHITLSYRTPNLSAGIIISISSWMLFLTYCIIKSRKKSS